MTDSSSSDIAIVGMACRFPGAANVDEFWSLLREGREARTDLSDEDLRRAGVPDEHLRDPNYVKAGMFLSQMEQFDPGFFGFSPLDGRILDPQHRHFLECSWEALEDAAYDPFRFRGAIGVFAGSGHNAYLPYNLLTNPELVSEVGFFLLRHTGNDKDFLATRVSYCFDLKGPSVNVQTACSTSLVAVHQASQSLINGECDMALAGGVTIELPHRHGYLFKDSEILSRDGHCRPFDASAGGTVFGSGVGVVVLKRLSDALEANDNIHAVIRASAVNNDGAGKVSYLAPSVDGQAAVYAECLSIADIDPGSVSYIAAHGTGTQLGDPIEVAALTQAYATASAKQSCALGSVKSNIGHTDTAAGVASLISVVQAMKHELLPPTLHFQAPNAAIDFANSAFFVCDTLRPWAAAVPRRAGVSSLGVGGTNAHVLVEQAPVPRQGGPVRAPHLLLLSARNEQPLLKGADRLGRFLEQQSVDAPTLADAAYTLAVGRRAFRRRAFAVVHDRDDAVRVLDGSERERLIQGEAPDAERELAFMFAGGGAQYPGMGEGLYGSEPVYRDTVDECLRHLSHFVDFDLRPLLFPPDDRSRSAARAMLEQPSRALPALFITQYAQARLWQSWGLVPGAMIGHSMGENTAACLAGVFGLRDAIGLVALRGRLFETIAAGSMLSVELDEAGLTPLLGDELSIAAVNAPELTVASGPPAALRALEGHLDQQGIGYRRIHINVAAHSSMLEPILTPFGDYLRSIRLSAPQIPFVSNRSGTWITTDEATSPDYWVNHLRHTVRFSDGIATLLDAGRYSFLEVGPGRTLASLVTSQGRAHEGHAVTTSMRHPDDVTPDVPFMLTALGRVWQSGVEVDWERFYHDQQRHRISLPTYAFEHTRCWVDPQHASAGAPGAGANARGVSVDDWFHQRVWHRQPLPSTRLRDARVLVLAGAHASGEALQAELAKQDVQARLVRIDDRADPNAVPPRVRASAAEDWLQVVDTFRGLAWIPTHVVNLLPLELERAGAADYAHARGLAFDALLNLIQAAGNDDWQKLTWLTVTAQAVQVADEPVLSPFGALASGPMRVVPREFPGWRTRVVDVADADSATRIAGLCVNELADAASWDTGQDTVAWRGRARFVESMARSRSAGSSADVLVRPGGVYLITGGTGGLGLVAAQTLAAQAPITLVLAGRHRLPDEQYWPALVEAGAGEAVTLAAIQDLRASGATVVLEVADVGDRSSVQRLAERMRPLGRLAGIVHTAGVVDDAPMLGKDLEQCHRVLAAKVAGTLNLDEVFRGNELDFVVLYSSTSAFQGLPGQVDYTAANAFLDAYAHKRYAEGACFVAVNWPAWRAVGMAANADNPAGPRLPAGRPLTQPLLHRAIEESADLTSFGSVFSVPEFWILNEHRIKGGPALIPGAGFLEIARAAFAESSKGSFDTTEMRDVTFDAPFVVGDSERRVMHVEIRGRDFSIVSGTGSDHVEHVHGTVEAGPRLEARLDIAAVRARCSKGRQRFTDPDHHPFLDFGERWTCLQEVFVGEREALIELRLNDRFAEELSRFPLHPAMLDMATAGAQIIVDGHSPQTELFVPIGCVRLLSAGALPAHAFSHVRYTPAGEGGHARDIARFDVIVADDTGRVVLTASGYTLRRVSDPAALKTLEARAVERERPILRRTLELGIDPAEGQQVLLQVLRSPWTPQRIVSPHAPDFVTAELIRLAVPPPVVERPVHDADADPDIPGVEAALLACPSIAAVFVRSFRDSSEERRLVAFFVPDPEHHTTVSDVRRYARAHLDPAHLPAQFVELDEAPRLDGGGINRGILRDPLEPQDTYLAPRTPTEKTLARVWQDVLGVERAGLTDNFFDLGGHSLLSTRVIVQVFKKMGVRLDQPTMVLNTLEQIAREVDQRATGKPLPLVPALEQGPAETGKTRGLLKSLLHRA